MWYFLLLNFLLIKVKSDQRDIAKQFVHDLVFQIQSFFDDNEPPPEFLLGVIDKAFTKFDAQDDNSIDAASFNQYMLGLMIIYIKYADDQSNFNSDFLEFFLARIFELDVYQDFKQLALDYRDGTRLFISQQYLTAPEKAACFLMRNFEHQVLQELNHQLAINVNQISRIFLRAQSLQIVFLFYQQISSFKNMSKPFDDFIQYIWYLGFQNASVDEVIARDGVLSIHTTMNRLPKTIDMSWSSILLKRLISQKVYTDEHEMVNNFIDELVSKHRSIVDGHELELDILIEIVIQAYKKFGKETYCSVSGAVFSQYLFGLMIVYTNIANARSIFINLCLENMIVLDACELFINAKLAYENDINSSSERCYCDVDLRSDSDSDSESESYSEFCYCSSYTRIQMPVSFIINTFKRQILRDLKYDLIVDRFDLIQICRDHWTFDIAYSLYQAVVACKDTSESFNDFIRSIGNLLISPAKRHHSIGFFSKPLIDAFYETAPAVSEHQSLV